MSGRIRANPRVSYTPKGRKIISFPMRVDEADYSIDVVFAGGSSVSDALVATGNRIVVSGALVNMKTRSGNVLKVRASKILAMEE